LDTRLFTPRGLAGVVPNATVSEVTAQNNLIMHAGGDFNISADDSDDGTPVGSSRKEYRIL